MSHDHSNAVKCQGRTDQCDTEEMAEKVWKVPPADATIVSR